MIHDRKSLTHDRRKTHDSHLFSFQFSVFTFTHASFRLQSFFHASFYESTFTPSHSLTASRIDLFSELNHADLGEFSINQPVVSACISFVLINIGFFVL